MFQYFVFCIIFGATIVNCANVPKFGGRIIGGTDVDIDQYPHQVSIMNSKGDLCAGSIIGDGTFILTAATCLEYQKPQNIIVRLGSPYFRTGGLVMTVKKFIADSVNNIAIIKLKRRVPISSTMKQIDLNFSDVPNLTEATVIGWMDSDELQELSVNIFSRTQCKKFYPSGYRKEWMCAGVLGGGSESCNGEEGGPLIVDGNQVGIITHVGSCGKVGTPSIYIRLPAYEKWIVKTIVALG